MAPPKTMAIGQQQQQQSFSNVHQSSPVAGSKSQAARAARNRKAKQLQSNQNATNTNAVSNPISEKTQQHATVTRLFGATDGQSGQINKNTNANTTTTNGDKVSLQKQQVIVEATGKQIQQQQPLNTLTTSTVATANANSTTNGAKTQSLVKINSNNSDKNSGSAPNLPAPSERTTLKQRKEAAATASASIIAQSTLDCNQTHTLSEKTTQLNTAPDDNKNLINNTSQQQQLTQAQLTPSSQLPNGVVDSVIADDNNAAGALITTSKHNQMHSLSLDDDIDAGIELDGSSNSGSSVKDSNEDQQMKSNSVSPVMQPTAVAVEVKTKITTTCNPITTSTATSESISDLVKKPQASKELKRRTSEGCATNAIPSQLLATDPAAQKATTITTETSATAQIEAVGGEVSASVANSSLKSNTELETSDATAKAHALATLRTASTKKTPTMTRDELAKERQVIDQDEQSIQERLESKQRKSSGASTTSSQNHQQQDVATSQDSNNSPTLKAAASATDSFTSKTNDKNNNINKLGQQDQQTATVSELINPLKNDISNNKSSSVAAANPRIKRQFSTSGEPNANATTACLKSLCRNCGSHVYQMERMLAEKSLYHKHCFRCFQCKMQLRIDNYASHEGQVYCKLHHKQIFQPQVKFNTDSDADSVAKSTTKQVDEYLLQRGRLSELTFSFLNNTLEGSRQHQMIICENEPVELSSDVVRSDTKVDDGINNIKLNLSNILQKFENGSAKNSSDDDDDSNHAKSSPVIEKPRFNIKQKLAAFENNQVMPQDSDSSSDEQKQSSDANETSKPVVGKLKNVANFLSKFNQDEQLQQNGGNNLVRKVSVKRSESLLGRLKKYESRIAGETVEDDDATSSDDEKMTQTKAIVKTLPKKININQFEQRSDTSSFKSHGNVPKLGSVDLSSLKNRWENGDIKNVSHYNDDDNEADDRRNNINNNKTNYGGQKNNINNNNFNIGDDNVGISNGIGSDGDDDKQQQQLNSPIAEKREELLLIRQQLAQRRGSSGAGGKSSVKNIYEQALKDAEELQREQLASSRRDSSDLNALQKLSTSEIQQQLLQHKQQQAANNNNNITYNKIISPSSQQQQQQQSNTAPTKDHFQLNSSRRANKLKERFELGLINNNSRHSGDEDSDEPDTKTKLDQIRQEKLEDLSVFSEGEIKAREARHMFQQIDRRLSSTSGSNGTTPTKPAPRSFIKASTPRSSVTSTTPATTTTSVGS